MKYIHAIYKISSKSMYLMATKADFDSLMVDTILVKTISLEI